MLSLPFHRPLTASHRPLTACPSPSHCRSPPSHRRSPPSHCPCIVAHGPCIVRGLPEDSRVSRAGRTKRLLLLAHRAVHVEAAELPPDNWFADGSTGWVRVRLTDGELDRLEHPTGTRQPGCKVAYSCAARPILASAHGSCFVEKFIRPVCTIARCCPSSEPLPIAHSSCAGPGAPQRPAQQPPSSVRPPALLNPLPGPGGVSISYSIALTPPGPPALTNALLQCFAADRHELAAELAAAFSNPRAGSGLPWPERCVGPRLQAWVTHSPCRVRLSRVCGLDRVQAANRGGAAAARGGDQDAGAGARQADPKGSRRQDCHFADALSPSLS